MRGLVATLLVLTVAGCAGGEEPPSSGDVVRAWADANRRGDVEAATRLFAVPALVANGTPEISLDSAAAIRAFNASLPCGSTVRRIEPHAGVLLVTFVLTDRPGGDCGDGVGSTARAALEVRDGRIVSWRRLDMVEDGVPLTPA